MAALVTAEIKEAIRQAYEAGLKDGFKQGAMAALNKVEPRHAEAIRLATYKKNED